MSAKKISLWVPATEYALFRNKCDFFDIAPKDILTELIIKFNKGELDHILGVPDLPDLPKEIIPTYIKVVQNGNSR